MPNLPRSYSQEFKDRLIEMVRATRIAAARVGDRGLIGAAKGARNTSGAGVHVALIV